MNSAAPIESRMQSHLDNLTKPKGSLGNLEDYCIRLAAIQGKVPPRIEKKGIYVFAGDHGVVAEGVSLYPQEVTYQMVLNFLSGGAAINSLAKSTGWELMAVDAGVAADFPGDLRADHGDLPADRDDLRADHGDLPADRDDGPMVPLIRKKIRKGTRNFLKENALTPAELEQALASGRELAEHAERSAYQLVAIGDMGIGNTTTAAALLVASGFDLDAIVDRGTGIDDKALERKRRVVAESVAARGPFAGPKEILTALGGCDLAMMAGFILGLRGKGIACVLDGFPVGAAAYMAYSIDPGVKEFLFAGHRSKVSGHGPVLAALGLEPIVDLRMRLGEGTGAVIGGYMIELGVRCSAEMASFDQAGVSESQDDEKNF
jgi:nicotinate-nucleotide--dimethylbenzimidazole phosphoribosyltransferase